MKATIISIGDEIMTGKTINTNQATIANQLFMMGIQTEAAINLADDQEKIKQTLKQVTSDLIIFTGGLGPTHDDLTKESVCQFYNKPLALIPSVYEDIKHYFEDRGKPMPATNKKQAYFPKDAEILKNTMGTAPGMLMRVEDQIIVLLPGPPTELQPMLLDVKNRLKPLLNGTTFQKGYLLVGLGESDLEAQMQPLYEAFPEVNIAPYAGLGEIKVIFTTKDETTLDQALKRFKSLFSNHIVTTHDESLESEIIHTLIDTNRTIALVESCTGGMISSRIVNVPGVSKVYKEGYILYDNQAKIKQLGINQHIMDRYGAVSDQCVYELAYQLAQRTSADVTLSVSGIAGPDGGTEDKPVGTVYFGVCFEGKTTTVKQHFAGDRNMIRQKATSYGLYLVWKALMHHES